MGHGHVIPNTDGSKARCGGPAMCKVCALELAQKEHGHVAMPNDLPERPQGIKLTDQITYGLDLAHGDDTSCGMLVRCKEAGDLKILATTYGNDAEELQKIFEAMTTAAPLVKQLCERLKAIDRMVVFENHGFNRSFNDELEEEVRQAEAWLAKQEGK